MVELEFKKSTKGLSLCLHIGSFRRLDHHFKHQTNYAERKRKSIESFRRR